MKTAEIRGHLLKALDALTKYERVVKLHSAAKVDDRCIHLSCLKNHDLFIRSSLRKAFDLATEHTMPRWEPLTESPKLLEDRLNDWYRDEHRRLSGESGDKK